MTGTTTGTTTGGPGGGARVGGARFTGRWSAALAIVLLLVLLVAVNAIGGRVLRSVRLDLTQGRQFTLTEGSRAIARLPEEPVTLTYYWSRSLTQKTPGLNLWGRRVMELLGEFERVSGGKIVLNVVDPEPFSEAEDRAVEAGLAAIPLGGGETMYMGLVGVNALDGREVIPYFDPDNERLLEYEIARRVYALARPEKKTVGLLSSLPVSGGFSIDPRSGQPTQTPAWQVIEDIRQLWTVKDIRPEDAALPEGLDVLLLIHPKNLPESMLYEIDQFVLKGGRLLAFIDPYAEVERPAGDQMQAVLADRSSDLKTLLNAWGVEMAPGKVAGDLRLAIPVNTPPQGGRAAGERVPYVVWMTPGTIEGGTTFNPEDAVTARLTRASFTTPGALRSLPAGAVGEGASAGPRPTLTPLVSTTDESMLIDAARVSAMPDPGSLLASFVPGTQALTLAARLSGPARTAFPQGKPGAPAAEGAGPAAPTAGGLTESAGPINVIVFADVDMLSDRNWIQRQDIGLGFPLIQKIFDNGDLATNALDNLAGSAELIGVRARAETVRPMTRVVEIQRLAQQKYLAEQRALEDDLRATEQKIGELQRRRPDGSDALVLTPEQQKEIEKFRGQIVETRRKLREVQLNLRRDIDELFTALKVANIVLVPLAVALAAVIVGMVRSSRRSAARRGGEPRADAA